MGEDKELEYQKENVTYFYLVPLILLAAMVKYLAKNRNQKNCNPGQDVATVFFWFDYYFDGRRGYSVVKNNNNMN